MKNSTLIEILRTFSKDEMARFDDFTASPYHNKKSNVTKLYRSLKKFAPDFPPEKIAKEEIWKLVFPGKEYNYGIMKNLIYDLNKLAVKFLELEIHSQKTFENDLNQLDSYRLKNLKSLFIKKLAESRETLDASPLDNQTHYRRYMLECSEMSFVDYGYLFPLKEHDYHAEINKSLLLFYCTNQLYHNISSVQYSFNSSAVMDREAHAKLLEIYDGSPYKDPYTEILERSYKALAGPGNKDDYENAKKVFFENYNKCAKDIQYDLTTNMLNFCGNNAQRGSGEFTKEEFLYIKLLIEDGLYTAATFGWIDQYVYMHSVMSACRVGEFDWAEKFINEHKHELLENVREQYYNYAYITLNLRRGRYEEALHYISKCRNADEGDKLNIKVFEFNAYYELGYYDELMALADTTNHFLKSDKFFSKEKKMNYKNYVTAIVKLMAYKCKVGSKYKNPDFLPDLTRFINENTMLNKIWLLRKMDELKSLKT